MTTISAARRSPARQGAAQEAPTAKRFVWIWFLAAGLAWSVAAVAVRQPEVDAVLNGLIGVIAGGAIAVGAWWHRPQPRWPWLLFAAGILAYGFGDVCYNAMKVVAVTPGSVSPGDVFYLVAPILLACALAGFGGRSGGSKRAARMLYVDSAALFFGGLGLLWFFVLDPQIDRSNQPTVAKMLAVAIPMLDLLLLALVARLALTPAFKLKSYRLLIAGIVLGSAGDILWRGFPDTATGIWVSPTYDLCYCILAAAALRPGMRHLGRLSIAGESGATKRRLVLLGCASLAVPIALLSMRVRAWNTTDLALFAFLSTAVPLLVVYRLVDLVAYAHRLAEAATRSSARMAAILNATPLPVRVLDPAGDVELMNDAAAEWAANGLFVMRNAVNVEHRRQAIAGAAFAGAELSLQRDDGGARQVQMWTSPIHAGGELEAVVAVFADVTEQREREEQLRHLADHDSLTGLLNRRGFHAALATAVEHAAERKSILALLDIDNFKLVNDSAGHGVGDAVLAGLTAELAAALRAGDVLARLSGDEIAVIISAPDRNSASKTVDRLLKAARGYRLVTNEAAISITASIGVCDLVGGTGADDAMTRADAALYAAKERGRNRVVVWNELEADTALSVATIDWGTRVKGALDENRLIAHLQPIVELATERVVAYEAVARLVEHDGTITMPGAFIPPASRLGLMPAIDMAILEEVTALLERDPTLRISINLDASSFEDDSIVDRLEQVLTSPRGLRGRLGIEITEHTSLRNAERVDRRLRRLQELGCDVAIDDFGTGFASFVHLRSLPANLVKISHNFIAHVDTDPTARALVEAIVTVAHALGKHVVAEGVERPEVAKLLRVLEIKYAQGYLFGKPMPPASARDGSMPRAPASTGRCGNGLPAKLVPALGAEERLTAQVVATFAT